MVKFEGSSFNSLLIWQSIKISFDIVIFGSTGTDRYVWCCYIFEAVVANIVNKV